MADNTHIQIGTSTEIGRGVVGTVNAVRNAIDELNKYSGILTTFGDTPEGKAALAASLELAGQNADLTAALGVAVRTHLTNVQSLIGHPYFVQLLDDLGQ